MKFLSLKFLSFLTLVTLVAIMVITVTAHEKRKRGEFLNKCAYSNGFCDPDHAECTNGPGSTWFCECHKGYEDYHIPHTFYGFFCPDIDDCDEDIPRCHPHSTCTNTDGSFYCTCNDGFTGDGFVCEDVNECAVWNGDCPDWAHCYNTYGSYYCECADGTRVDDDHKTCTEPCKLGLKDGEDKCGKNADCHNHHVTHACVCQDGYEGNGEDDCEEIDECELGIYDCPLHSHCDNSPPGDYRCICDDEYTTYNDYCYPIDGCADEERVKRECSKLAECKNIGPNQIKCECLEGYSGDGHYCGYYIKQGGQDKEGVVEISNPDDPNYSCLYLARKDPKRMKQQLWYTNLEGHIRSVVYDDRNFYEGVFWKSEFGWLWYIYVIHKDQAKQLKDVERVKEIKLTWFFRSECADKDDSDKDAIMKDMLIISNPWEGDPNPKEWVFDIIGGNEAGHKDAWVIEYENDKGCNVQTNHIWFSDGDK